MKGKLFLVAICMLCLACSSNSKKEVSKLADYSEQDVQMLAKIYKNSLSNGQAYENLRSLCKDVGHRLSGSANAAKAVDWSYDLLNSYGLDSVWKQECLVTHWERGEEEYARIIGDYGAITNLACLGLGGSVATPADGIRAKVIEVQNFEQLKELGEEAIKGKIVFYNRPMDQELINTFHAYGGCVNQRSSGASEAAPFGAVAVLVRSMNLRIDDYPHTGVMRYEEGVHQIPALAISTKAAEELSNQLKANPYIEVEMKMSAKSFPDAASHNVIAELKGSEFPEEIILVGGHLDSWDVGEGAHDDGAGVVQSIEVLRLLKEIGYQPKRTLRAVMYMNEENGAKGAKHYAEIAAKEGEKHIAAVESDRGGFTPRGFSLQADSATLLKFQRFQPLFTPYYADRMLQGYGGVDISFLKDQGTLLIGFEPDPQRYFIHHHAATDVFEAVDERELELGAAAITSLLYLIDQYGTDF